MQPGKIFPQLVIQLPKVNDSQYPPQRKSFSMLAYYNDHQIENYDWFMRMDDDSVLQWDNLNELLERDNEILLTTPLRISTVKLEIPGKALLKSESRTSVPFKVIVFKSQPLPLVDS